jgi:ribosomal protein S10
MINLSNILLEGIDVYSIEALIKTIAGENKVEIYNQVRAVSGIVVVTIIQSDFLDNKSTNQYEYSLLKMKYIVKDTPENDINTIKSLAVKTIPGLVSFVPRLNTLEKKGAY